MIKYAFVSCRSKLKRSIEEIVAQVDVENNKWDDLKLTKLLRMIN